MYWHFVDEVEKMETDTENHVQKETVTNEEPMETDNSTDGQQQQQQQQQQQEQQEQQQESADTVN